MQKSSSTHNSSAAHRRVQHSSTLNRKYVKRPANTRTRNRTAAINSAAEADARAARAVQKAQIQKRRQVMAEEMNRSYPAAAKRGQVRAQGQAVQVQVSGGQKQQAQRNQAQRQRTKDIPAQPHPLQTRAQSAARAAGAARSARATNQPQFTAQQRKDAAIASALRSVATMNQEEVIASQNPSSNTIKQKKVKSRHTRIKQPGSGKRFLIAFSCAAACVAALAVFISVNSPDLSVKVAAMQTGIDASYPSYVPRDYSLSEVMSEDGKITMTFVDGDANFTLTEEQSSWDTTALLNNYVKPNWNENYTATHEQGVTIYMSGSNAVWVNGSIFYTITDGNGDLTKKQIRNIITSL